MEKDHWALSKEVFTNAVKREIADKYDFDLEKTNFKWWVEKAGALYLLRKRDSRWRETRKKKKLRLQRFLKAAENSN